MNVVRKHLSRIKGGRLARAGQRAAEIVTLAISDVPHDDPSAIASGPTVPDPTTLADARALVAQVQVFYIDDAVRRALDDPSNESCKPGDPAFARATFELLAKPKASIDAAVKGRTGRRLRDHGISAPISKARPARSPPTMPACVAGARATARRVGDHLRRRAHGHRARQRPRRPEPGICAGARRPAQGHAWTFRRSPPTPTAPTAAPAAPPDPAGRDDRRQVTFAKMKQHGPRSRGLSGEQRRHRLSSRRPAICC